MKTLYLSTRKSWRAWLKKNHQTEKEIWLIYYKTHTGKLSVPYEDSVEEALCFGWIDSIIKKLDNDCYARKFTPRTNINNWSQLNIKRVKKMLAARKMTKAGLNKIAGLNLGDDNILVSPKPEKSLEIPPHFKKALMANKKAYKYFNSLANSYKRNFILWIDNAKKEDTRSRRIEEAIMLLSQNKRLGLK
jgi:uncharacterized protein YdeI (YjbR/CyaY-like superfamily)